MTIEYRVAPVSPETHYLRVRLRVSRPDPAGQLFVLPAWIPGSYKIRDFARHVVRIDATADGAAVELVKRDKQTWQAEPVDTELELSYDVYAWDLSVRGAHLDQTHAFFNGTSVFLRVAGQEQHACDVVIGPPDGAQYDDWRLVTTLPAVDVDERGFGRFRADSYQQLIDYPVEMGTPDLLTFEVDGVRHDMAITWRHAADKERIAADLARICQCHADLFGTPLPIERYLFLTTVVGDGYGGLEHRDSTALICRRDDLPRPGLEAPDAGYRRFLGLCSHEYFHLWNVKRIRPQAFVEADLTGEVHTELLWAFEGITSYYDELALARAGCVTAEAYLGMLAETVTRVQRGAGRFRQTVAESSFDAWTKFYQQDENAANAIVSYYAKGALVALGLDVTLRLATDDRRSLDDLMRMLWQRHGEPDIGVPERGVEALAIELGGESLRDFFDMAVRSTDELPLEDWFAALGVGMRLRQSTDAKDLGGGRSEDGERPVVRSDLGLRYESAPDGVRVSQVPEQGAAAVAGVAAGDLLIAIDDIRLTAQNLDDRIDRLRIGVPVELVLFRRDELMRLQIAPRPRPADTCELWPLPDDEIDTGRLRRRNHWLARKSE